jgi:hypothetical protein
MRRQLQICSEADYLRAHLTTLHREPPKEKPPVVRDWKARIRLALKKWVMTAESHLLHRVAY